MGNSFFNCCCNIYPPLLTDEKNYLIEMQEFNKNMSDNSDYETQAHEREHKASIEYYEARRTYIVNELDQDEGKYLVKKQSCEILTELQARNLFKKSKSTNLTISPNQLTFDQVQTMYPWIEIKNCPGRYIIKKGHCSQITPQELLQNSLIKMKMFDKAQNCRDKIGIITFIGGALLTYYKENKQFVHTLNNMSGLKRKLNMLGIQYTEVADDYISVWAIYTEESNQFLVLDSMNSLFKFYNQ